MILVEEPQEDGIRMFEKRGHTGGAISPTIKTLVFILIDMGNYWNTWNKAITCSHYALKGSFGCYIRNRKQEMMKHKSIN